MKNKFYVTTPLYYVNAKPHVGTLYSTILADVAARWNKLLGKEVFFLTGTDEHGQKIQETAESAGKEPKEFVDSMIPVFKKAWQRYSIEYDRFIRTTDKDHEKAVISWINKLIEQDDIYKSEYVGWYCVSCEAFVSAETEAIKEDGKYLCPTHKRELKEISEESYFFRLSAYEDKLLEFYEKNPNFIVPRDRINEVISFVKSGLKDLSISRKSVSWGIPFPGDSSHTVYVWGDALNNYITGIGYGQNDAKKDEQFNFWWPADRHIMAKDIVRFHAVFWPAFLMAAGLQPPKQLLVHGYILMDQHKMSKSLGNVMDPHTLADWYGVDQVRYYLMSQMSINQDGNFDLKNLEEHINADLANNLGNLLNRTISLALKNNITTVTPPETWEGEMAILREHCEDAFRFYWEEMNKGFYHVALAELWKFISSVNAYFHKEQPWVLAKKNPELFAEVISATCHSLYWVAIMLWPIMPTKMEQLLAALGKKLELGKNYEDEIRKDVWNETFTLTKQDGPLFVKPESHVSEEQEEESKNVGTKKTPEKTKDVKVREEQDSSTPGTITIDDLIKVDLRVGTITTCEPVEKSNKLYKMSIDLGPLGTRTIFAGVAKDFTPEDLINKQGVFVANLKPRKMMGSESQGMMLVAKQDDGSLQRVTVAQPVENGSKLS